MRCVRCPPLAALLLLAMVAGPATAKPRGKKAKAVEEAPKAEAAPAFEPAPAGTLTIGIPRPLSAQEAADDAKALEGYLSEQLRKPVQARTFAGYDQLADALGKGQLDLAWITPLSYVKASSASRVFPLVKAVRKGLYYRSVYFVRDESKAKELADLKGRKVGWVDPGSAAGFLFPRAMLVKKGIALKGFFSAEKFLGDHKSVCNAVLKGEVDAGATFANGPGEGSGYRADGCGETVGPQALDRLRVIAFGDRIPNEVVAAREGFDEGVAAQVTGVFSLMPETDAGRGILSKVFHAEGFGMALEQDFDAVRAVQESVESGQWIDPRRHVGRKP